jgi:putative redox protein
VELTLQWNGGLSFNSPEGAPAISLAGSQPGVVSPTQALAYAVMGCMGMDIVYALEKGRHQLAGMTVRFDGERAPAAPRRFVSMTLHFEFVTTAAPEAVERAIERSRDKYCSVWHTIRPDVVFTTTFTITPVDVSALL